MNSFDCTVIGDAFIDVIVHMDNEHNHFLLGGTTYSDFAKAVPGGSGNVAVGLSTIGGAAAFVGKCGRDFFGKLYKRDLEEKGVTSRIFLDEQYPTGLVTVLVKNREQRSFLVFRGANDRLTPEEIDKAANLIKRSKYVYISGFSIVKDPQRNAIFRAVELAKKFKTKIVFDPGAFNLVKLEKKIFDRFCSLCDVFSPNLDEACAMTNATDIDDIIDKLREKTTLTVLKCSEKGCILIGKDKVVRMPGYRVKCLDPTGAGDAFTAGVIYGLSHHLSLESASQLANWFAAGVVAGIGPRSFPKKSRIEHFLNRLDKTSQNARLSRIL